MTMRTLPTIVAATLLAGARPVAQTATTLEEAKRLVATDPVIVKGEMVAEYHAFYGSAALMLLPAAHEKLVKKSF
jgi:hypothetical protein